MTLRAWLRKSITALAVAGAVGLNLAHAQEPEVQPLDPETAEYYFLPDIPSVDNLFRAPEPIGYYSYGSNVGSIVAMPDFYYPGTINTVTRDMIRDQQALSFSDILRDIGGAVQSSQNAPSLTGGIMPDQFFLRGLEVSQFNFRKNGFLDPTYTPRDFANVERIDVLKGPASALYGGALPSGTVNVVTKTALADRFGWGGVTLGSDSLQRYAFDVNSTNEAGDLLVRVNGAYQNGQSFRNFGYNEREFIAPVITKLLSSDTALTWEGEFHQDLRMRDSGTIAVNGNTKAFAPDVFFGSPTDFAQFHDYRSTLSLTHRFNEQWQLYVGGTSLFYDATSRGTTPQTGFTTVLTPQGFYAGAPGLGGTLNRTQETSLQREQDHSIIANLTGEIDGPFLTHNLLLGTEANWLVANQNSSTTSIPGIDPALTFDPATGAQPFPGGTVTQSFSTNNPGYYQNRFGIYLQDLVPVTDRLTFTGGVRWDTIDVKNDRQLLFGGFPVFSPPPADDNYSHFTPRAGVTYDLVPQTMSIYGAYTQSFAPPSRTIYAQAPLQAETGEMWEIGLKTLLDENLIFTVSGFVIDRDNVAVQITNFNVVNTAEQQSKGVELNLVGQWNERFRTVSNYTYADVEQSGPPGILSVNGRVRGVPFGNGNVWTRYDVIQAPGGVLGLGLGYVYVGERRGDYSAPLQLPSYSRWDVGVFGQYGRWDMTAYFENIFDIQYATSAVNQYQVYQGAPANFRLMVGANF
ncbi:TonB-dependent siderophore receptor [Anatilimnocola floriformis]|uniref:TonB-dependent siderophore receptor n=1 Tax=Anatilimnocola floriformis TaxID=2948575 RepID=UPI0020C3D2BC|nr:TonB-dependent siderophore receptor [Anatilimnocola floriformis]